MKRTVLTAATVLVAGTAGAQPTTRDASAVRREVEALNRGMETAFNRGDLKAVSAFYATNAVIRTAHAVAAQGRAAVDRYFAGVTNPKSWKLDVYGVTVPAGNNLVYQTGLSTLVSGSPERTSTFQFVVVWERQPDGTLKIILDYYHAPETRGR